MGETKELELIKEYLTWLGHTSPEELHSYLADLSEPERRQLYRDLNEISQAIKDLDPNGYLEIRRRVAEVEAAILHRAGQRAAPRRRQVDDEYVREAYQTLYGPRITRQRTMWTVIAAFGGMLLSLGTNFLIGNHTSAGIPLFVIGTLGVGIAILGPYLRWRD